MANVSKHIQTLQKRIPVLEQRLALVQPLVPLANQMKVAKIRLRVFFVCEGKEVDLARAN
jgi:hypothetical protein